MRGRKPRPIEIASERLAGPSANCAQPDPALVSSPAGSHPLGDRGWSQTQILAFLTQCDESTVRRTCRRYERLGLSGLLESAKPSGRPIVISPPATCPDHRAGLPGDRGRGPAYYPLDKQRPGPAGGH